MGKFPIPFMSLAYFIMAIVWLVGAIVTFGSSMFWLFVIMIPVNIFAGVKMLNR